MQSLTINPGGRPTVVTPERLGGLIVAKRLGLTDVEACEIVEIDRATLYRHLKNDLEFRHTYRAASLNPVIAAGVKINDILTNTTHKYSDSIAGKIAMFVLERLQPELYGVTCRYCKRKRIAGNWQKEAPQQQPMSFEKLLEVFRSNSDC